MTWLALVLILLLAAYLRFYGLAWDSGYLFHPDERKILLIASELRLPANALDFFSADSPLNPKFFAYGSFPIYLLKALSVFAPPIALNVPWREDFISLAMLGRVLSVLFDLGTIGMTYLLARRLYDATIGLLASACIAVTVLHIQLAHFYTVDTVLTFFIVATMYSAARYAQSNSQRDAMLVGVSFGLALATKIAAAPLIVPIIVAVARSESGRAGDRESGRAGDRESGRVGDGESGRQTESLPLSPSPRPLVRVARIWLAQTRTARTTLAKILVTALVVFVVTQPYVLLDPIRFFGQVGTELLVARGWLDYPYTRQYADTLPFVYPIVQSGVWGMSLPLGIFAWAGSALFAWRWWQKREWADGFILAWALVYFLTTGALYAKYLRYLLPLLPFLFLMASVWLKSQIANRKRHRSLLTAREACLLPTAYCLLLAASLVYSVAFVSMYSREHPWLTISKWMYANIPPQSTLAIEHWDDALPVPMRNADGDRTPTEYRTRILPMHDADDARKLDTLVEVLSDSDYLVLATQRLSSAITRLPQRYPMSSRYYQHLFEGELGFQLQAHARNDIALNGIVIMDDRFNGASYAQLPQSDAVVWNWGRADESFAVYDHPLPLVFKKTRALSRDELRALLSP